MTAAPRLSLIVAVGSNGVIGSDNQMPWRVPEDFAFFKRTTMGHTLVMGRRTFDSIGRPLPGRRTVVVTRQTGWVRPGVETAHSLVDALEMGRGHESGQPHGEVFVAGGAQVYVQALPLADRLLVTEVDQSPPGDAVFPRIDPLEWRESARVVGAGVAWVTYERHR